MDTDEVQQARLFEPRGSGAGPVSPPALRRFHAGLDPRPDAASGAAAPPLRPAFLPEPDRAAFDEAGAGPGAVLRLYGAALGDGRLRRVEELRAELDETVARLDEILGLDERRRAERASGASMAAELGKAGSAFFDVDRLGGVAGHGRGAARLQDERRERLVAARTALDAWRGELDPVARGVVFHRPGDRPAAEVDGVTLRAAEDPLAAAADCFEELAAAHAGRVRALRVARLEARGAYDPARHTGPLATLRWESFSAEELALLPAVAALERAAEVRGAVLGALSQTLLSGRPLHALVVEDVDAALGGDGRELARHHPGLGYLAVAHREAVVVETTLARPDHALAGLRAVVAARRPGVALVATAPPEAADPAGLLEAALHARVTPCLRYDPTGGPDGAPRFDIEGNPDPTEAWPAVERPVVGADGLERTLREELTPAHVAALLPALRGHLHAVEPDERAADQIPVAAYVAGARGRVPDGLPYVHVAEPDGRLGRAIVSRELAFACFDRWRYWTTLRTMAMAGGDAAAAPASASAVAPAPAPADSADVAAAERRALEGGIARLVAALVGGAVPTSPPAAASGASAPAPTAAPSASAPAPAPGPAPGPAPAAPAAARAAAGPFIDSMLCTSCNECIQLNGKLFVYDENKQARIGDPSAGTFAQLVKAAERCPARCIHPGAPRPDDRSATPKLVARAAKFN